MYFKQNWRKGILLISSALFALMLLQSTFSFSQATISTGSIAGTVTDPSGAVLEGAKVVITNINTSRTIELTTNGAGGFNSAALQPGTYQLTVTQKGFNAVNATTTVQVGNISTVNVKMPLGQESTTVEVQASNEQVNTEQATVQGVLNAQQVESLPVNGRNFLDLAQIEPGVQIQDGQNFDPTKAGYSSISFGGRFGRTARVNVDGVDSSDETVGTVTSDIPASAIEEFQLSQSSLDLSQDLTSSGAVNVITRSGTNDYHGEGFYFIRDHNFAAASVGGKDLYSQRHQYGGRFGGPIIKSKLFFFLDGEHTKQDSLAPVNFNGTPYADLTGGFSQPFRETNALGKLDYDLGNGAKAFYRYSYFDSSLFATFGSGYSVYDTKNVSRQHVIGLDWAKGTMSHSIRFSYLKFENQIVDATTGNTALPGCCTGLLISSLPSLFIGPSRLAPQGTPQSNHQIKYDGSKVFHNHTLRYGFAYNHIQGGGFADFYGIAPRASYTTSLGTPGPGDNPNCGTIADPCMNGTAFFANTHWQTGCPEPGPMGPCFPGGDTNPLNYAVNRVRWGNGLGFSTEKAALGFPAGGLGPDDRIGAYIGDSWKIRPNLTFNIGVRYDRDTGRTDSDLGAVPEINQQFPGYGNPINQPNLNFAPQAGFAWDPKGDGKMAIRGGIGMFYENVIYNNVLFDRPFRLRTGAFNQVAAGCQGGQPQQVVPVQGGLIAPDPGTCKNVDGTPIPIGLATQGILDFWHNKVLPGNPFDLNAPNPNFIGNFLSAGAGIPNGAATGLFAPNYKTPVSVQMNVGIQRELRRGMVFSADYLRNIETRSLLGVDVNADGSITNFNQAAAVAAISQANAAFGCGPGSAGIDCAIGKGATILNYADHGLGNGDHFGTGCTLAIGPTAAFPNGQPCAFGGINPSQATSQFLKPIGRSVYNALQMKLVQNVTNPVKGVKSANFQVSYSFSDFSSIGGQQLTGLAADSDQDFVIQAADTANPGRYYGPSLLDRRHQISFGGFADVPLGFRLGIIGHFYSPLSSAIVAPTTLDPGIDIFQNDFTGDGTTGDPLPGTKFGQFGRKTDVRGLSNIIANYNANVAGQPTPAGAKLVTAGLITPAQLNALGAVAQSIAPPPDGQVPFAWLKATDLKLSWRHTFRERWTVEPSVGIYNLFNFANFNLPPTTMTGILFGPGTGSINGTSPKDDTLNQFRVGNGTGVYSLGSQRQIEFGMRLEF
jgi:hypothetical protein